MSARENVLSRVRAALRRADGGAPAAVPDVRLHVPEVSLEDRIEQFCSALGMLAAKTYVAPSREHARDYVSGTVGNQPVVLTASPFLAECGIHYESAPADRASFGITGAEYGLADTGTLVVMSRSEARLASLLPPVHIAVVSAGTLLTGLDELLQLEPLPAESTASMVLITGPSRTADIEQILVRGVHGPGELHVVVVL